MKDAMLTQVQKAERGPRVYPEKVPETGFVRLPTILAVFPVGRSTWWAGVRKKIYPQPVKLGPQITAWRAEDIRALIEKAAA